MRRSSGPRLERGRGLQHQTQNKCLQLFHPLDPVSPPPAQAGELCAALALCLAVWEWPLGGGLALAEEGQNDTGKGAALAELLSLQAISKSVTMVLEIGRRGVQSQCVYECLQGARILKKTASHNLWSGVLWMEIQALSNHIV